MNFSNIFVKYDEKGKFYKVSNYEDKMFGFVLKYLHINIYGELTAHNNESKFNDIDKIEAYLLNLTNEQRLEIVKNIVDFNKSITKYNL